MSTAVETAVRIHPASNPSFQNGRLTVHVVGRQAGHMRLDLELPLFDEEEAVRDAVQLVIPGETTPLEPVHVEQGNGDQFVITFMSADIANAGHLPAEAVVAWDLPDQTSQMRSLEIVSATEVARTDGVAAIHIPHSRVSDAYPRTVGIIAILSLAVLLCSVSVFLLS